jgi:hypothetical protein
MVLQLDPNLDLNSVTHVRAHLLPISPAFTRPLDPTLFETKLSPSRLM